MAGEESPQPDGIWRRLRKNMAALLLATLALPARIAARPAFRAACLMLRGKNIAAYFTAAMGGIHAI